MKFRHKVCCRSPTQPNLNVFYIFIWSKACGLNNFEKILGKGRVFELPFTGTFIHIWSVIIVSPMYKRFLLLLYFYKFDVRWKGSKFEQTLSLCSSLSVGDHSMVQALGLHSKKSPPSRTPIISLPCTEIRTQRKRLFSKK